MPCGPAVWGRCPAPQRLFPTSHYALHTQRIDYGAGMARSCDVRTVLCFDSVWISGGVFFRRNRVRLHADRMGDRGLRHALDQAVAQPLVRYDVGFHTAGDRLLRIYGGDLRKIRAGRAAADDCWHSAGFDAGRPGPGGGSGWDAPGRGNRGRRRHCDRHGAVVSADHGALRIQSSTGSRHHYRLRDDGATVAAQPGSGGVKRSDWRGRG